MSETQESTQNAPEAVSTLNDERAHRLSKRAAIMEAGGNPYPEHSEVTAHVVDIEAKYADLEAGEDTDDVVSIGGRIMAKRGQGKIAFVVVRDTTAEIQLFCRINEMREEDWALLQDLDLGDIINVTGVIVRTKRGQLSIAPKRLTLLSKAVRPLPEKFHGLSDKETRYRQRYVDLIMNDDVRETFRKRSAIVSAFRRYMEDNGYMEVETPILQTIQGGATAKPFITHFNALNQECYLRIATELHLKRLLVGGYERVFEIGRIFRNEGMDQTHNPEFTTMEAYRAYSDLEGMKELAEGVIKAAAKAVGLEGTIVYQDQKIDLFGEWPSRSMTEIVSEVMGRELNLDTPIEELRAAAAECGIDVNSAWGAGKLIAEIYDEKGEESLINPTFVCDYPVEVSPLAKRREDDPRLTHRFELVIAGHEYANAFSELNDPVDQAERFAKQMEEKAGGDDEAMEYDEDYVRALGTACLPRAVSASASTAWSCCSPIPRASATCCCSRTCAPRREASPVPPHRLLRMPRRRLRMVRRALPSLRTRSLPSIRPRSWSSRSSRTSLISIRSARAISVRSRSSVASRCPRARSC